MGDPKTLRLTKEVKLGKVQLFRGGQLLLEEKLQSGEQGVEQVLAHLEVPCTLALRYDDLVSTTMFDREGPKPRSLVGISAPIASAGSGDRHLASAAAAQAKKTTPCCCIGGPKMMFRAAFRSLGR